MGVVEWSDPPARRHGRGAGGRQFYFTEEMTRDLKAKPGRWAVVFPNISRPTYSRLRRENTDFEFTAREVGETKRLKVWARYPEGA